MQPRRRDNTNESQFFWKSGGAELRDFPTRWHEDLVNTTVGIIMLGAPHLTPANRADQENILGVVTRPKTSRRSKTLDKELMDLDWRTEYVRSLSEAFEKYISQFLPDLPVLSIWDGRESKAMRVEETKLLGRRWRVEDYVVCYVHTIHSIIYFWPSRCNILTPAIDSQLRVSQDRLAKRRDDGC
jgi:hypothetical protein